MSSTSEKNLLRFGCPACGIRLVVDQSIAGTEGPCPSCGARIIAPPVEVGQSLEYKEGNPVEIKPRAVPAQSIQTKGQEVAEDASKSDSSPDPEPVKKQTQKVRSVSPTTALSTSHMERKNFKTFVQMLLLAAIVAVICGTVYYILQQAK